MRACTRLGRMGAARLAGHVAREVSCYADIADLRLAVHKRSAEALFYAVASARSWVTRRTIGFEFPGTRDAVRRTTLDARVPKGLPGDAGDGTVPVPIGLFGRGQPLVGFNLWVDGRRGSLVPRKENEDLTLAALMWPVRGCSDAELVGRYRTAVEAVVFSTYPLTLSANGEDPMGAHTDLPTVMAEGDEHGLFADSRERDLTVSLLELLYTSYVLFARVPPYSRRTLLKWEQLREHDSRLPSGKASPRDRLPYSLLARWPVLTMELPEIGFGARGFHTEVRFPRGIGATQARLPTDEAAPALTPAVKDAPVQVVIAGAGSRVQTSVGSMAARELSKVPEIPQLELPVRPNGNWLAACGTVSAAAAVLWLFASWWVINPASGSSLEGLPLSVTTLAALLISLGAAVLSRPDDHEVVHRARGMYRGFVAAVGASTFLAIASSAAPSGATVCGVPLLRFTWGGAFLTALTLLSVQLFAWFARSGRASPVGRWLIGAIAVVIVGIALVWVAPPSQVGEWAVCVGSG